MVFRVPLLVLMSEAVQVAQFIQTHWEANDRRPGLESVGSRMPYTLADGLIQTHNALQGGDASMSEESFVLAEQLAQVPATPTERSEAARNLKWKRDLLACLLQTRILKIRSTARFVYRRYPDIYREVTSAYERKRRAAAKRAKMEQAAAGE